MNWHMSSVYVDHFVMPPNVEFLLLLPAHGEHSIRPLHLQETELRNISTSIFGANKQIMMIMMIFMMLHHYLLLPLTLPNF